jgi:hypothetical protein
MEAAKTSITQPTGIQAAAGASLMPDGITSEVQRNLATAADMHSVEAELQDLQDSYGWEFVKSMFPKEHPRTGKELGSVEQQCQRLKAEISGILQEFAQDSRPGSPGMAKWQAVIERGLQASMIGPVIERLPAYTPFKSLVLMQSAPKDFREARNGIDPLEYEDPIDRGEAFNFNPESDGPMVVEIAGNRTTIYPYFKQTPRHALSFWEWAKRQIKPIVIKKRQLMQELNKGWDDDLITSFDAIVPDGTLYSSHSTHTRTIANAANAVTQSEFRTGARYIRHTDSATGTVHIAPPGFALCDPLALDDIEAWGTDVWTEEEVSDFAKKGFGQLWDETLNVGKKLYGYSLLQTPIETASNSRRVRYFARKEKVGYFIPVTVNNKRVHVNIGPTKGDDPDVNALRNVTSPPGYTFTMEAWEGGAIQIINQFSISKINHA